MFLINTYEGLHYLLNKACPSQMNRCLVAIVFADSGFALVKDEIIPFLKRFNVRSGRLTHFFFAGYVSENAISIYRDCDFAFEGYNSRKWYFSATAFDDIRCDLEQHTKWKFSGGVDFLLLDAVREPESDNKLRLQFDQVVFFDLWEVRDKKLIPILPKFFEEIFRYSESNRATIMNYSDDKLLPICVSVTTGLLETLIPNFKVLKGGYDAGRLFAVKDFRNS